MKSGFAAAAAAAGYIITEGGKTHTLQQKHSNHFKLPEAEQSLRDVDSQSGL